MIAKFSQDLLSCSCAPSAAIIKVEMRAHGYILTTMLVLIGSMACGALPSYTFDRYKVIIDRQPFGEVQSDAAAASLQPAGPVAPPFTKDLQMCAITKDELGVQVGFVNVAMKPPKSYLLRIGEMEDYIELVDADYEKEMALLKKDQEELWISMDGSDMSALVSGESSSASGNQARSRSGDANTDRRLSYAERLRRRREARVREVKPPELEGEALEEHLKKYQMELIRKGMPPLPMELTPEMDAQLVSEGVLPPVDDTAAVPAP